MKVQYIGNFNDGTGWAKASTYNALALDNAGYDIYCKEVKYNNNSVVLNNRIIELLNKQSNTYDVVIQHVLPSEYSYFPNCKNIGFIALETLTLSNPLWLKKINLMDEIFVPNKASMNCLIDSKVKKPIKIFNHSFDYAKLANFNPIAAIEELKNTFNFVFVGEFTARKNLLAVLRAFHSEFDYIEPVNLYIKTNRDLQSVTNLSDYVKRNLGKTNKYKKESIVVDYMNEDVLLSTMKQCHAFVIPSYGEAWCYPAMEAMALGLPTIYTDGIGVSDYASVDNLKIESSVENCFGVNDAVEGLYTCNDFWLEPKIYDLRKNMRDIFSKFILNAKEYSKISEQISKSVEYFDYRNTLITKGLL